MQQAPFSYHTAPHPYLQGTKKTFALSKDQNLQQELPFNELAKNVDNSIGCSETNYSSSRSATMGNALTEDRTSKTQEMTQEINLITDLRKGQGSYGCGNKMAKLKKLLPKHLAVSLSAPYQMILRVARETDHILSTKVKSHKMQSFQNLKSEIEEQLTIEVNFELYMQVNFLVKDFYHVYCDPLKNFVIGLPLAFDSLPMRKYQLRKQLYLYALSLTGLKSTISEITATLPQKNYQIFKTTLFFPQVVRKGPHKNKSIIDKGFRNSIEEEIKLKEMSIQRGQLKLCKSEAEMGIEQFVLRLAQLFRNYQVRNIYKVNVIEWFMRRGITPHNVCEHLERVERTGVYLYSKTSNNSSIIYQLKEKEQIQALSKLPCGL